MAIPLARALSVSLCLAVALPAHGGSYRGPGIPVTAPPGSGGPPTGGPRGPSAAGPGRPTTGSGPTITEEVSWQVWWEFNKEPFLFEGTVAALAPTTGSDDFYLGARRGETLIDALMPTDVDVRDRIVPALGALLERERNRDVQTACLMALAKIGMDGPGVELEPAFTARLPRDDQEVRETATLALGVAVRPKALTVLLSLVNDTAAGRKLVERDEVGNRTRAFAAYGLGLLARRSTDGGLKTEVHDALWKLLENPDVKDRDLRTAAINGLGLLVPPDQTAHKRLAWLTVEQLLGWWQKDLGRGDELVQAQASIAIGRLLGRGSTELHERCKAQFAAVLNASTRRSHPILQGAAQALGMLALPAEVHADDAATALTLRQHYERGHDRLTRYLCTIALGRIGGASNRAWLLEAYRRGNKNTERPWLALALGVLAHGVAAGGEVDGDIARALVYDLPETPRSEVQAALAVGLGLTGYTAAVPIVQRLLREREHDEDLAGYLCISLALLGDPTAAAPISGVLERSQRRPFLLLQAAIALGRLGDRDATMRLLAMIKASESVAVLAALANAIGQIGDRRAIEPLIEMSRDQEITKLARAFVAAALGGIGDRSTLPWNVPLSKDCNYAGAVDTLTNGSTGVLDIL